MIVKYVQSVRDGIRSQNLTRHAIGYVIRGTKYIYDGDRRQQVSRGAAFYLGTGHHYMADIPDTLRESFEQMVRSHIFSDISIESLAEKCNRSMTAFKMEFRRHFEQPPHRWFIQQRLMHSRLLLISTNKSISEIGNECTFPDTSHFIKLFKKEYGLTPASYRHREAERQNSAQRQPQTRRAGIPATA